MALAHAIMLAQCTPVLGVGGVLEIQQGGHSTIPTVGNISNSHMYLTQYAKMPIVWNGNVFMPIGSGVGASSGWAKYNHELNKFELAFYAPVIQRHIPIFDRVGFIATSDQGWGMGIEDRRAQVSANHYSCYDYATSRTDVAFRDSTSKFNFWAYPFTAPPAGAYSTLDVTMTRIVELGGKFYSVWIDDVAGTLKLYELTIGGFSLVGVPSAHLTLANFAPISADAQALFKYNDKLFMVVSRSVLGSQRFRCFEFDPVAGTSIEQNAYLPANWTTVVGTTGARICEVRDSISPTEQVFLIYYEYGTTGWECYEFVEGAFTLVDQGAEAVLGGGGVIYDPNAKATQFKAASDSVPSNYVQTEIEVFDLEANGTVDIDPRYRWGSAESPPYDQCTGKAPYNTVTGLASKPTLTTLPDLDDDFVDGIIDEELWERVTVAFENDDRDFGTGNSGYLIVPTIAELAGAIRFGRAGEASEIDQGLGIRAKSRIDGEFQIDFTVANPENLAIGAVAPSVYVLILVKTGTGRGFGFMVWKNNIGTINARGIYLAPNAIAVHSVDAVCADGDVLRIARSAIDVWTLTHDPAGGATDITPAGGAAYPEQVYVTMGARNDVSAIWVLAGTAVGSEPGISNIAHTGVGTPGLYQGGVKHRFDWDHITDLGAGQVGSAELYVDSQRV